MRHQIEVLFGYQQVRQRSAFMDREAQWTKKKASVIGAANHTGRVPPRECFPKQSLPMFIDNAFFRPH
jgi:hypothetical protein